MEGLSAVPLGAAGMVSSSGQSHHERRLRFIHSVETFKSELSGGVQVYVFVGRNGSAQMSNLASAGSIRLSSASYAVPRCGRYSAALA